MTPNNKHHAELTRDESETFARLGAGWVPGAVDPVAFALELETRRRHRRLRLASAGAIAAAAATALVVFGAPLFDRAAPSEQIAVFPQRVDTASSQGSRVVVEPGVELGTARRDPWVERAVGDPTDPRDLPAEYGALGAFYLAVE